MRPKSLILLGIIVLAAMAATGLSVSAQQATKWSPLQRVKGYSMQSEAPLMVADSTGVVHAFNSQLVGNTVAVVYRQWSPEQGWTDPADVLLAPQGTAKVIGVHLDQRAVLHVVFFGWSGRSYTIYYSRAHASVAGRAASWSSPKAIAGSAGPIDSGSFAADDKGNMFVVYSGNETGNGVYALRSRDGGVSWSEPAVVYLTFSLGRWGAHMEAVVDSQGNVHAVWAVVNDYGLGEAIYYSRLESGQSDWSEPMELARVTAYETNSPAIVEYKNELFLVYHNGAPPTRWMRRSADSGRTWADPVQPFGNGLQGGNGPVAWAIDGNNVLQMVLANRVLNPETYGVWRAAWLGDRWSPPEAVVSGPRVTARAGVEFDPAFPQAVIARGNVLLATWRTDTSVGRNGVWYSYGIIDAPQLPAVPLPAPEPTPAPTSVTSGDPNSGRTMPAGNLRSREPRSDRPVAAQPLPATQSSTMTWLVSLGPVVLIVSLIAVAQAWRLLGRP